jgi:hypothetical protein
MRRSSTALVFVVLAASLGGSLAASAATANDTACRKATISGSASSAEILSYNACRFDKLDAQVAALKPTSTPTTTPSATASSTPKPSASPSTTATASPTASPTVTTPSSGKPGATNTGVPAGTTLTAYTGPKTITTAGTVIDGKDVSGALRIEAKNVVIKNSKVHGSDEIGIYTTDTGSATITDSEVYGFQTGLVYSNFTALRLNLHDLSYDGVKLSSNASVRDSWIHAPKPTSDAHWDGIQVQNGVVNTVISGNNIDASGSGTNSALFLCPDLGPSTAGPLTVSGNWLAGGNFTVAVLDGNNGQYFVKDIRVTNNRFVSPGQYGYSNVNVPITQSGNVIDSSGAAYTL